ncbi:hypothetical protein ACFSTE_13250 [Aquimarina hainanensis]|uniref:Uncharacterized protein n=1 Tax=Aquimarina hainanensis TaxID=1578017 RepID=A0ABW5N8B6_9FLAO
MGGNPAMDRIENLIGINRKDHEYLGEKNHFKSMLYRKHMKHLERSGKSYDKAWIIQQIEKYD